MSQSTLRNVIVVGTTGAGKSTCLNDMFGSAFKAARGPWAVSKSTVSFIAELHGIRMKAWDTPGVLDGEVTVQEWYEEIFDKTRGVTFHQMLLVVNATSRPATLDVLIMIGLRNLMKGLTLDRGVSVVFTHVDAAPEYLDQPARAEWIAALNKKCKFKEKNITEIDINKSIVFLPKKLEKDNPTFIAQAADQLGLEPPTKKAKGENESAGLAKQVFSHVGQQAVVQIKSAADKSPPITPQQVDLENSKNMMLEMLRTVGQDAWNEYADKITKTPCYDADSSKVMRWNDLIGTFNEVLAVDVEVGDKIMGASLMPDEVIIKNVHEYKGSCMNRVTACTTDGQSYSMTLSRGHHVLVMDQGKVHRFPSCNLKVGQTMKLVTKENATVFATVSNIESIYVQRAVSLRTRSLTLVVNKFVASSHAEGDAGWIGHALALLCNLLVHNGAQKLQNFAFRFARRVPSPTLLLRLLYRVVS